MTPSFQFTREFLRDRRQIGSIVPSGTPLAREMVRALGLLAPEQVVVELGPGTGVVTEQLARAWPDNRLLSIEFLPAFASRLESAFPSVEVIHGNAARLLEHLEQRGVDSETVGGVVSSLPLLSLEVGTREAVFGALRMVLEPGRRYVQFTYLRRSWRQFMPDGFTLRSKRKVWRNFPPATVFTFVRN